MKSFFYKTILAAMVVFLGLSASQASAQFVQPVYTNYSNQLSYSQDQSAYIAQLLQLIQQLQAQQQVQTPFFGTNNFGQVNNGQFGFVPTNGSSTFGTFSTGNSKPRATVRSARDIEDDSAEVRGEVDMNDYNNGVVFFVVTDDEDDAEDVKDEYDDFDEVDDDDDDDFQVILVDRDLDEDEK